MDGGKCKNDDKVAVVTVAVVTVAVVTVAVLLVGCSCQERYFEAQQQGESTLRTFQQHKNNNRGGSRTVESFCHKCNNKI